MHLWARIVAAWLALSGAAAACGPQTDCTVGNRTYRIDVGASLGPAPGALVYAHGYRGTAAGAMRNAALRKLAEDRGMMLVALQSSGVDWGLDNAPPGRSVTQDEEMDYVAAVLDDVEARFGLDRSRTVATGFSAGGMMTWTVACHRSELFAGFAPVSGTFWDPVPGACPAPPAPLVHIHGTTDEVVPLGGRPIGPTRQGDVPQALALYARHGGPHGEPETRTFGDMTCRQSRGAGQTLLAFCTFEGGHSFSTVRLGAALDLLLD